jgi:hypothetical protein
MTAFDSPFQFAMEPGQAWEGAAFSLPMRLLGTGIVGTCALWTYQLLPAHQLSSWQQWQASGWLGILAALAILLITLWFLWTSRTRLDAQALSQSWMWKKSIGLAELSYVKVIRIQGLDWLIAPRVYCRNLTGKLMIVYVADRELLNQCLRLERELAAVRKF